jgi:hypothetical protein
VRGGELKCFSLASLNSNVKYFRVRQELTPEEHLSDDPLWVRPGALPVNIRLESKGLQLARENTSA